MNNNLKKYNTTPFKHILIIVQNFIESKYCHDIAVFKEKMLFNYEEEFLKRYYKIKECYLKIPKFILYYKNYLVYFCIPMYNEITLN